MLEWLLKTFFKYDYDIVGEYYDNNGNGEYTRKYIRKYYIKGFKKIF